jgi:hypothetical protein
VIRVLISLTDDRPWKLFVRLFVTDAGAFMAMRAWLFALMLTGDLGHVSGPGPIVLIGPLILLWALGARYAYYMQPIQARYIHLQARRIFLMDMALAPITCILKHAMGPDAVFPWILVLVLHIPGVPRHFIGWASVVLSIGMATGHLRSV